VTKTSQFAYKKVKYALTELLRQNKWIHSQAIPSEPLLARRYQVSVGTIRRAINELVAENILIREQGRGTFVVSHTPDYMLNVFFRIESHEGARGLPNSKLISFETVNSTKLVAKALALKTREQVYKIRTLLSYKNLPAIVDEIYLSVKLFPGLDESFFENRVGTLYGLFQRVYGITVVKAHETVEAIPPEEYFSNILKMDSQQPLLCVRRVSYAYKGIPVDLRIRYIHSGKYRYFNNLGGG